MSFSLLNENWSNLCEGILVQNFPLHRSCRDGDIEQLNSLLSTGNVNLYEEDDFYGWTPIHWAAYFGKLQCLMRLLENGGSCDATTERLNQTPAHIAAYGGHCHCLKWLLHCGATINRQLACLRRLIHFLEGTGVQGCDIVSSKFSQTPVHLSVFGGHPQCLYWLIQSKCDVNLQDYMGETPIHKAARTGSMECVSLLVSQGARLSVRNQSGNTACEVAASSGYQECANYIEQAAHLQAQSSTIHPTQNGFNHAQLNGRSSPEGQSSTQTHFISTNTYHSHPYYAQNGGISNGVHIPLSNDLNLSNNNNENCDMEMGDTCDELPFRNGVSNRDVLLNNGVSQNLVPLAGKKRGREDFDHGCFKRAKNEDHMFEAQNRFVSSQVTIATVAESMASKSKFTGWLYNNGHVIRSHVPSGQMITSEGHMTGANSMTAVSESMVEHMSTVTVQQGYDSMLVNSMGSD
ncbi:ankyrin repeat domain-containing protein 10-like isoform X2 [Dreissena polymorpha]|uniref:ankyrin repeat domain-containing protein 10-like isoform X2 n=1 Tax=Dreissena polymorpha TaxID=45954 RepID=UPI002263F237|nr:ankyrin repeat domain-containing protein 10-like isoform X2 [Dreissena polymorpha]